MQFEWDPRKAAHNLSKHGEDDLRPEYDLKALRLVKRGPGRKAPAGRTVQLAPDVAEAFPDEAAVNEALRFLLRATRKELKQGA